MKLPALCSLIHLSGSPSRACLAAPVFFQPTPRPTSNGWSTSEPTPPDLGRPLQPPASCEVRTEAARLAEDQRELRVLRKAPGVGWGVGWGMGGMKQVACACSTFACQSTCHPTARGREMAWLCAQKRWPICCQHRPGAHFDIRQLG